VPVKVTSRVWSSVVITIVLSCILVFLSAEFVFKLHVDAIENEPEGPYRLKRVT